MKCLETRKTTEGFKRRRYQCEDGSRITTIEVPLSVWNSINKQGRGADRAAQWARERAREATRIKAVELVRSGWKPIAVASELGLAVRNVHRWSAK